MRRGAVTLVLCLGALATSAPAASVAVAAPLSGSLVERHGDPAAPAPGKVPRVGYVVSSADDDVALEDRQDPALVGQRVVVRDRSQEPGVQGQATAVSTERLAAVPALGPRKVAVVLVNFKDNRATPITAAQIRATVFADTGRSVNTFYAQQSGGATSITGRDSSAGDVYGWYQLPMASTDGAAAPTGCDVDRIAAQARSAAAAAGVSLSGYDQIVYYFPTVGACTFGGLGDLPGQESWINGYNQVSTIAHELGHNFGVHHAAAYACTGAGGIPVSLSSTCTSSEYGDPVDVMGSSANLMSGFHRARLGQLPVARQRTIKTEGTYALGSVNDIAAIAPGLLLVPRRRLDGAALTQQFALDIRTAGSPFDVFSATAPSVTGVTVRLVPTLTAAVPTQLIDTTPATTSVADAPLQPGQELTDPISGIVIRAVTAADGSISVFVHPSDAPDTSPPTAPGSFTVTADGAAQRLTWTESSDDVAVARYEIYRNAILLATTEATSFRDPEPTGDTATYRVDAVDTSGNRTASPSRTVTLPDTVPPGAVPSLTASRASTTVTLRWGAATDNRGVASYRVSRDDAAPRSVTGLEDVDAAAGSAEHTYAVAAVDPSGNVGPAARIAVAADAGLPVPAPAGPVAAPVAAPLTVAPPAAPAAAGTIATIRPAASYPVLAVPALRKGRARLPVSRRLTFAAAGATRLTVRIGKRAARTSRTGRLTVVLSRRDRARGVTIRVTATTGVVIRSRVFRVRRGIVTRVR